MNFAMTIPKYGGIPLSKWFINHIYNSGTEITCGGGVICLLHLGKPTKNCLAGMHIQVLDCNSSQPGYWSFDSSRPTLERKGLVARKILHSMLCLPINMVRAPAGALYCLRYSMSASSHVFDILWENARFFGMYHVDRGYADEQKQRTAQLQMKVNMTPTPTPTPPHTQRSITWVCNFRWRLRWPPPQPQPHPIPSVASRGCATSDEG